MRRLPALAVVLASQVAWAHGMRTAYLEVTESQPGSAVVTWRQTFVDARTTPRFPPGCVAERREESPAGDTQTFLLRCDGPLAGRVLVVDGLGPLVTETVLRASLHDGTTVSHLLTPENASWRVPGSQGTLAVLREYALLGVVHILAGPDHLLFLLALVLLVQRLGPVLLAETAFTVSHSVTLSATALGWLRVSSAAAEACIALSLVLLAADVVRAGATPAPRGRAAGLAFVFGLVHGLGFADGLREVGLPETALPSALAGFALGVELGQLAFLVLVCAGVALCRATRQLALATRAGAYVVGVAGAYWLVERVTSLLQSVS